MHASPHSRLSPSVLSRVVIVLSSLWFASAYAFYFTNRQSKDGWSATPLPAMLALVVVPFLMFVLVPWLVTARRAERQRLRIIDRLALGAAAAPFVFVAVLLVVLLILTARA